MPASQPTNGLTLHVDVVDGLDAGRGVCRLHEDAAHALGVRPWEPVMLWTAVAREALLCGYLPATYARDRCQIDSFTARTLQVVAPATIGVGAVKAVVADRAWVQTPPGRDLPIDAIRTAMLGKALLAGTPETLLPQDFNRPFTHDASTGLGLLRRILGPDLASVEVLVTRTEPEGVVLVGAATQVMLSGDGGPAAPAVGPDAHVTLADLGGLEVPAAQLREVLELAFHQQGLLDRLGARVPSGVLVLGPPGAGKAELTYAVARAAGAAVVAVPGIDLELRGAEATLTALDDVAGHLAQIPAGQPAVVLVQEVDRLVPAARDRRTKATAAVLEAIKGIAAIPQRVVVATTAVPEACAPELFAVGRIERRIEIPMPDITARRDILTVRTRALPLAADVDLGDLAARTPGYVGADLARLCREAAFIAASRASRSGTGTADAPRPPDRVGAADFESALHVVRPMSLGGQSVDTGTTTWADVGNAETTKQALTEAVVWPIRYPETFARLGLDPPRGVLLFGPPGTGKTFIVRALANESAANLIAVKGAELLSKWVGESESGVREMFRRARSAAPSIVFLDEIDALAPTRGQSSDSGVADRVVAALLTELDGIEPMRGVAVIGSTNRPDLIDPALLRPGRLERHVLVGLPDEAARLAILTAVTRKMPLPAGVDLGGIAAATDGYSAADLDAVAREAGFSAMRRDPQAGRIEAGDLTAALGRVRPSVPVGTAAALAAWTL